MRERTGMQVVFHMGAHCTEADQLVRSLARDRKALAEKGIFVPPLTQARPLVRDAAQALAGGGVASPEAQAELVAALTGHSAPRRVVLSSETFLGATGISVGGNRYYPRPQEKAARLARLFPDAECQFLIAIRNPTTFLPALRARLGKDEYDAMAAGTDPLRLRWSDLVRRLLAAAPRIGLTVWCDEDSPLIWSEVLSAAAGTPDGLSGELDRLGALMTPEGLRRLEAYIAHNPPPSRGHSQRIMAAFLDKYGLPEALEQELDMPGWTASLVDALTAAYEADTREIASMEGVTFLSP